MYLINLNKIMSSATYILTDKNETMYVYDNKYVINHMKSFV